MTASEWRELAAKITRQRIAQGLLEDIPSLRQADMVGWFSAKIETMELERDSLARRLEACQRELNALTQSYLRDYAPD